MIYSIPFPSRPSFASFYLPLTLISLEDWALVMIDGPDVEKYLQSQVTVDIATLTQNDHILCGHCDANGKMWSTLRLFHRKKGFAYIERLSVLSSQLAAIKKYSVFSKVKIATDDAVLLGVAGYQAREALATIFNILPNSEYQVVQYENTTLLQFTEPSERFLIVTNTTVAQKLLTTLYYQAEFNNSSQWLTLEIEACSPIIDIENSKKLIPQATNLQALQGISFNKGCYTGQEIVARANFRNANKRAMYWLEGKASRIPNVAENLELQLGEKWCRIGTVLAASALKNGSLWIQAVMKNDLDIKSKLRVCGDTTSQLLIKPLPYNLKS